MRWRAVIVAGPGTAGAGTYRVPACNAPGGAGRERVVAPGLLGRPRGAADFNQRPRRRRHVAPAAGARRIAEVAGVAEQSSAAAEQVSASTQQTSASTQEIASSASELAHTAEQLNELVGRFRVSA